MSQVTFYSILWIAPLLVGGVIAAANADGVNEATEKFEAWLRRSQATLSSKNGWFSSYILHPIFWIVVKFCDWTDTITHRGLKNGARAAATLYLVAAWCFIIYVAVVIVVAVLIVAAIFYVILKIFLSSDDSRSRYERVSEVRYTRAEREKEDISRLVGVKGKRIYTGTNWFNEELKGRVDDEGNIYRGTNWFNEEKIGRIDNDGTIYEGTSFFNETKVGRIDEDGNLHKGTNWFNEERTGRIDKDGNIHKGTNWLNEEKKGRTGD